jgi:CspA family cold shock protein
MKGKVKWFNEKKGYGFITTEEGKDVFVHYSTIQGEGYRSLQEGDEVECEVTQGPKGPQTVNVKVIG